MNGKAQKNYFFKACFLTFVRKYAKIKGKTEKEKGKMSGSEHKGHRERLRGKILVDACCEHEYLEMFLCYAIPRRNTNDIAHRLLSKFGCLPKVLSAPIEELQSVKGVGDGAAALLKCMGKLCEDYTGLFQASNALPETYERDNFLAFINQTYESLDKEVLDVYLMDSNSKIFRRERFSSARETKVWLDAETFSSLRVKTRPSGVILVHNHPLGEPEPSALDDLTTKQCAQICSMQNVVLCNHFIYANRGIYDYYGSGKLAKAARLAARLLEADKERGVTL